MVRLYTSATLGQTTSENMPGCWIDGSASALCRCSSVVEQLICNQLVGGSSPFAGSHNLIVSSKKGRLPEWLKGTDCKSVGLRLRRFESYTSHYFFVGTDHPRG